MNESSYSSKNLHQRLTRCSCEYSSVVILLYLTDIGMQAAAFGKDLRGDLQGKKKRVVMDKSREGCNHATQSSHTVIQKNKKQSKGRPNFA